MLVPVMAGAYLLIAFVVIIMHLGQLPAVFALIVSNAFAPQAAVAGVVSRPGEQGRPAQIIGALLLILAEWGLSCREEL